MNIGQFPPFFIWPYALFYLLTKQSIFFMLEVLTSEQRKYLEFYESVQGTLEETLQILLNISKRSLDGDCCGELVDFVKNATFLVFGTVFLVLLKLYIIFRHFHYIIFVMIFYWCSLVFKQNGRNRRKRECN